MQLITLKQLAMKAGVCRSTIQNLVTAGAVVPPQKVGRETVWPGEDEAALVASVAAALRKRTEEGNAKRAATNAAKPPSLQPQGLNAPPPYIAREAALILGSEQIVAAIEMLQTATNKCDSLRAQSAITLQTLMGALISETRTMVAETRNLVAEFRGMRKDMNDAFEALVATREEGGK